MTCSRTPRLGQILALAGALWTVCPALGSETGNHSPVAEQRRVFREVYKQAELGDWRPAASQQSLLRHYLLWPDLRAAWLRTRIRNQDYADVDAFLEKYPTLGATRELRYRYALSLAQNGHLAQFLQLYQQFYQGLEVATLDCFALQAELNAGRQSRIINRAMEKWLTGRNQVAECDPVFAHLMDSGILGAPQYQQRFDLAIEARQFPIARYLARSLNGRYQLRARQWSGAADKPAVYLSQHDHSLDSIDYRKQLLYATEQLAYKQPIAAATVWDDISRQYAFSAPQRAMIERHVALWAARNHTRSANTLLNALPVDAVDVEVRRWRVRVSLQDQHWPAVLSAIENLPAKTRQDGEWQYWQAQALRHTGQPERADLLFKALAAERSFYGFLAADRTGQDYAFAQNRLTADEIAIDDLASRHTFKRARELFLVGLEGRGRSEWDSAVARLPREQQLQASILAHRWGWHSRAIATAASAGHFDDLELRYPLPYRSIFEKYAGQFNIEHSWVLGISRSESLFMRDIRSSAGAIGLMQLMPETGRRTANEFNLPYSGPATLTNPEDNIRLGTAYLQKMLARFDGNRILATAAYNAGPLKVESWLPEKGAVDAWIWIENIPYNETRSYVRRVLATEAIFHWRLTGSTKHLSTEMTSVVSATAAQRLARSR